MARVQLESILVKIDGNEVSAGTPLHTPRLEHAGAASAANTPGVRLANGNAHAHLNGHLNGEGTGGLSDASQEAPDSGPSKDTRRIPKRLDKLLQTFDNNPQYRPPTTTSLSRTFTEGLQ